MPQTAYERLTAFDNSFLLMENDNAYLHMGSAHIFEAEPLRTPEGGIDVARIKAVVATSLHMVPRYRQRLAYLSREDRPVWVDDERFNLDYHIRHTSLPRPGNDEQLKQLFSRVMQQHLDRARPLWEIWVVEGLRDDRFAIIAKVHHCMIDGMAGVDLMKILFSLTPEYEIRDAPPFFPRPAPSGLSFRIQEAGRRARMSLDLVRDFNGLLQRVKDRRHELLVKARAVAETMGASLARHSKTPLNKKIGPHRRCDWFRMDLEDVKTIRRTLGGSVNDVVLTIVTGAVQRFMIQRQLNPRAIDFVVMAPVSVRTRDQMGSLGNRVSAWLIKMPIGEIDPRRQLELIRKQTRALKESKQAVGADILTQAAEWMSTTLLSVGTRNISRLLPFNMVVTNVPGPQFPLYMVGARMLEVFPHVPIIDQLGIGVALLSYNGKIFWGFNADYDLVPDLWRFIEDIRSSFEELLKLSTIEPGAGDEAPGAEDPKASTGRKRKKQAEEETVSAS